MNRKTLVGASALAFGLAASACAPDAVGKITEMDAGGMMVTFGDGNTQDFSSPECRADTQCT